MRQASCYTFAVLGLGTVNDALADDAKTPLLAALGLLKNPVTASLALTWFLVWFLTFTVAASQSRIERKIDDNATAQKIQTLLLRQICVGTNPTRIDVCNVFTVEK